MIIEHIGTATLYRADCRDVLAEAAAGASVVLTDPPYGIAHKCNYRSRGRGERCGTNASGKRIWQNPHSFDYPDVAGDDAAFDPAHILGLDLPTVLWGANYYADKLPPTGGWLVWDKDRPDSIDQATVELAWTNYVKGARRFRHMWNGFLRDSERGENYHATQKPVALMQWVLTLRWTPPGAVLDPYMGSGPVGVACAVLGRPFVGIELSDQCFEVARGRIRKAQEQRNLFTESELAQGELAYG